MCRDNQRDGTKNSDGKRAEEERRRRGMRSVGRTIVKAGCTASKRLLAEF